MRKSRKGPANHPSRVPGRTVVEEGNGHDFQGGVSTVMTAGAALAAIGHSQGKPVPTTGPVHQIRAVDADCRQTPEPYRLVACPGASSSGRQFRLGASASHRSSTSRASTDPHSLLHHPELRDTGLQPERSEQQQLPDVRPLPRNPICSNVTAAVASRLGGVTRTSQRRSE